MSKDSSSTPAAAGGSAGGTRTHGPWLNVQAASALSLVLMGDSLIYAVLPVMAHEFGVGAIWVGVLLSANRFARLLVNFSLVPLSRHFDLRTMGILGVTFGALSTIAYGLVSGVWLLLAARIIWGASYSMLRLMTQGYATLDQKVMAHRLGLNASVTEAGPILVYTLGAWLVAMIGPRETFVIVGLVGLAAILLAFRLPKGVGHAPPVRSIRAPRFEDLVAFTSYFARSGIFMTTASLLFYGGDGNGAGAGAAVLLGSLVLLAPRIYRVLASPLIGRIADRLGIARIYLAALTLDGCGFLLVGLGHTIPGLALLIVGGTSGTMLLPAIAVKRGGRETLLDLASNATWSDLGAALGALAGGSLIAYTSVQSLYLYMALALLAAAAIEGWMLFRRR